jgi:primosomal protein N' (replication factor Y)
MQVMVYLEVAVADNSYHGTGVLTYHTEVTVRKGELVFVPLKSKIVPGVVTKIVQKPPFKTRPATILPSSLTLPAHLIDLILWMQYYYAAPLGSVAQLFIPKKIDLTADDSQTPQAPTLDLPFLTDDQRRAITQIEKYGSGVSILHGDTGTGKTRIYIELVAKTVHNGKSAIILTPEIGLTSQLSESLRAVFGGQVIVLHSRLSETSRKKIWTRILSSSDPLVIIGARSALFSPLKNLGLIVVDEMHETAYKQDSSPRYYTPHVASKLGSLLDIPVVLGSATPPIADYFFAEQKGRPIIRMTQTAKSSSKTETSVTITDLRNHTNFTKSPVLSDKLIEQIKYAKANGTQSLLFLNRRGTARIILCDVCGWQANCPHCDIPVVYHSDTHTIRCHSCNYNSTPPVNCHKCYNDSILFKSAGTKAIYNEAKKLFPSYSIMRFDNDNKKEERFEQHYNKIREGKVDIIIATQTIAKGLDLPRLSTVGIVVADTTLFVPDFSAHERTYQLLNQVAGRVGRGHVSGTVFVQTYDPGNRLIKIALGKDWQAFYSTELDERRRFLFPPYCYMLKLWCRRATQKSAQEAAEKLADLLKHRKDVIIEGPAPAYHEKINKSYQWQIIVKSKQRNKLIDIANTLPPNWNFDLDPVNLL